MLKGLVVILAIGLVFAAWRLRPFAESDAVQIEDWPFDRLFKEADLVVIAKAVSTGDAGADFEDEAPERFLKAVLTTLKVIYAIKGEHRGDKLEVLHYRMKEGARVANWPMLVEFHAKEQWLTVKQVIEPFPAPK
jgi:hypothetical protein